MFRCPDVPMRCWMRDSGFGIRIGDSERDKGSAIRDQGS